MGEQEEKEIPQSENSTQPEVAEAEPKETDKMLEKKDDKPSAEDTKSKNGSKPTTPTATEKTEKKTPAGSPTSEKKKEEIIDIPEEENNDEATKTNGAGGEGDERKMSGEEREVKPKKIPIGGLKLPGFFVKNKPKGEGDGAEGELLEKEPKEEEAKAAEEKTSKKEEKPGKNFGQRLRSFFVRKPAAEKQAKQAASNEADNKSGKFFASLSSHIP